MAQNREPKYKVAVERNLAMRTRDGVTLRADVYHPDSSGKFPVLVMRTPYDKSQEMAMTERDYFPPLGYVLIVQDTRGRFSSEGEFAPFVNEARDGYDTIEWAASLPWSNGKVGEYSSHHQSGFDRQGVDAVLLRVGPKDSFHRWLCHSHRRF